MSMAGLEAASAAGVLHRDIKPSNCFVEPDGTVKIGDFGLSVSTQAREESYTTESGVILGTPAFASPEQLRGDDLDLRADLYSVGATLYTLLTDRAPIGGENVVQVVANVLSEAPRPLREEREDVPIELERVVLRCLAKDREQRYADYASLRRALLPFGSREPRPASLTVRVAAGWIDYLLAFLVPYVAMMLAVGNEAFHLGFLIQRTFVAAIPNLVLLGLGVLAFTLAEGLAGGGPGKRWKGLRVVRPGGGRPGLGRALVRILVPVLAIEVVRIPLLLATITSARIDDMTTFEIVMYSAATGLCPMIPVFLLLGARRENGFATVWDRLSGTRVVVRPEGRVRPVVDLPEPGPATASPRELGPYRVIEEIVPGSWLLAEDAVLRRHVWLLRRKGEGLSDARRRVARPGRPRWLQDVASDGATWDVVEATRGEPLSRRIADGKPVPWGTLRHWLHDLASELWAASRDGSLPEETSLDHVWITADGRARLLDHGWPRDDDPAARMDVGDLAGQQGFLAAAAALVDETGLPLHARSVLRNLEERRFEKLSFLAGTLRGLLDRPAEVGRGIRAGSIFVLPTYAWVMAFVGAAQGAEWLLDIVGGSVAWVALTTAVTVLAAFAAARLFLLPFGTSDGHATFRLAVVDDRGRPAGVARLLARWAIVWLPLLVPMALIALVFGRFDTVAFVAALAVILPWIGVAIGAALHPHRGLHDRLAGTRVVRR
jgi:uncharacterized RDD family membrane protein YckC